MKSLQAVISETRTILRIAGIESWEADARLLAQHGLRMTREELFLYPEREITESEEKTLKALVERRLKREPVSRITGLRGFWKSDFKISPETLDPRPDSECLIETACRHLPAPPSKVLDLGTGSGCLLLSLLLEWPKAQGVGLDISAEAVRTATENAVLLGQESRVRFMAADWEEVNIRENFDVIISNPPYIAENEISGLEPEVALYDPLRALAGGEDGLACYRSILRRAAGWLTPSGYIFFEIGATQAAAVGGLLEGAGFDLLEVARDLGGRDRCIAARRR